MATPIPILFLFLLLTVLAVSPSTADENNVFLTGEVLATDSELSYGDTAFVMQGDCNLVLYNNPHGFQSNTYGRGTNCTLTLNQLGQLVIRNAYGYPVWTSPLAPNSKTGTYAAILRPDGQVGIYGASVWSSSAGSSINTPSSSSFNISYSPMVKASKLPMVRNMLFSDQIIYKRAKLTTRDYTMVMKNYCTLALVKASVGDIWVSPTQSGQEQNCFASLSHHGELVVNDFGGKTLWSSNTGNINNEEGEYVLVLQINGEAVIYGPLLWSTASHY